MPDDDRPDIRLVFENMKGHADQVSAARREKMALDSVSYALRRCTANLMRICRGAGNSSLIGTDFSEVVDRLVAYRETCGRFPLPEQLDSMLRLERPDLRAFSESEQIVSDAEHDILRGSLQFAAASLLDQLTHQRKGSHDVIEGVLRLHRFYSERDAERAAAAKAERAVDRALKGRGVAARKKATKKRVPSKPVEL